MPSPFARVFLSIVLIFAAAPLAFAQATAQVNTKAPGGAVAAGCANAPAPSGEAAATLDTALEKYRTGHFDTAIGGYESVIASGDKAAAPYAYAGLARAYLKLHKVDEAYDAAQKANALTPNAAPAVVALGEVYYREGKFTEAETAFRAPCTADARSYLGLYHIYMATSNYARAGNSIRAAFALDPNDPEISSDWNVLTESEGDRMKFLEDYLASPKLTDPIARANVEREAAILQDQEQHPEHVCQLVTQPHKTEVSFVPVGIDIHSRIQGYGVDVRLNNSKANLELVTSTSGILLDRRTAKKAGVKSLARELVYGSGDDGPTGGYTGIVDSLRVGDLEFEGCYVTVVDRKESFEDDGEIGGDVFRDFLLDLDFPDAKLKLSALPQYPDTLVAKIGLSVLPTAYEEFHDRYIPMEMKDFTRVFRLDQLLLVPTSINGSEPYLFALDTGSSDDMIDPNVARTYTHLTGGSNIKITGLNGQVTNVATADQLEYRFGRLRQDRHDVITFDHSSMSDLYGAEITGELGFRMLQLMDVKIDYRDGLVNFTYDPHRFH